MNRATMNMPDRATRRDDDDRTGQAVEGSTPGHNGVAARPGLICLAAGDRDRAELDQILARVGGEHATDAAGTTRTLGVDAVVAAVGARRAVLAGPDAVAAIIQGRTAGIAPTVDLSFTNPARTPASPAVADSGVATAGAVPSGPFADQATPHDRTVLVGLTPRESEVARLVGDGLNVGEIAGQLGREKTTVISHRRSLLRKIGCRDALGIARFAYRTGLARP